MKSINNNNPKNIHNIIKWGSIGRNILSKIDNKAKLIKENSIIYRKFEFKFLQSMKEIECSGRIKLTNFDLAYQYLTRDCGIQIGHMQENLFNALRTIILPLMFQNDLVSNIQYLKKKLNIREIFNMFAALYPRREGKTVITCIVAAIFMVSQPKANVICYNLTKRQADLWMEQLLVYLSYFSKSEKFGWSENHKIGQEVYSLKLKTSGMINTAYSYPCGLTDGKINILKNNSFIFLKKNK